jgi:hypothetical protein
MFNRIKARSSLSILMTLVVLLALSVFPVPAQEETPLDGVSVTASDGTEVPNIDIDPATTTTAGTLWSNGPADQVNGLTSMDPPNIANFTARTADDFQLASGCPLYAVSEIRVTMQTSSVPPDAYIELYNDSGVGGPVNAPPFASYPSTSNVDLGWNIGGHQAYEFTIPTPGLSLSPGNFWLAAVGIPDGSGSDQAFFATAGNGVTQLDQGYFLSAYFGFPTWSPTSTVMGSATDFAFDIDGYCQQSFPAYVRSTVGAPWGASTNEDAMDMVFGAGNWADLRYETVAVPDLFHPLRPFVYMEGGEYTASELEAFLGTNQAALESWVVNGGCLILNAAPDEDDGMSYGFGGVVLTYPELSTNPVTGLYAGHPVFNGPFTPIIPGGYSGNFFAHGGVSGGGIVPLMQDAFGVTVAADLNWGDGYVLFGGMTTDNWHLPQPEAHNLRANMIAYTSDTCAQTNAPPVLDSIGDKSVDEENLVTFTAAATDPNVPPQQLTFSLDTGAPPGASIDPLTGEFTWTPTEAQGPGDYPVTVRVTDDGTPVQDDFETITITVYEVNNAPVLHSIGNKSANEEALLSFSAVASDVDLPPNTLTFSLDPGAPAGANIHPTTGAFTWTPTEIQGPGVYPVTVRVTDNGIPSLDDFETFNIIVNEVNRAPVLNPIGDRSVEIGNLLTFITTASDADLPPNTLTFSLDTGAPAGASIGPVTGVFTWIPIQAQGTGVYPVTVRITDDGVPSLDDFEAFNIYVYEVGVLHKIYLPIVQKK